jgi:hypothetical protein
MAISPDAAASRSPRPQSRKPQGGLHSLNPFALIHSPFRAFSRFLYRRHETTPTKLSEVSMQSTLSQLTTATDRMDDEILTVEQVANRLQLKTSWVYTHADQLGAYRAGKYLRFRWQRVLEHLERTTIEMAPGGSNPALSRVRKA